MIIMRATLHDRASNTYYGQWPRENAAVCGHRLAGIAHNGAGASTKFGVFDAASEISQEIARRLTTEFALGKKEKCAAPSRTGPAAPAAPPASAGSRARRRGRATSSWRPRARRRARGSA